MFLQRDDARPHTNAATSARIENTGIYVLLNPPLRPDFATSDFPLIAFLKKYLKGHHFTCDDELMLLGEK
jgi:hypothetical protein